MGLHVIKRDGTKERFCISKLTRCFENVLVEDAAVAADTFYQAYKDILEVPSDIIAESVCGILSDTNSDALAKFTEYRMSHHIGNKNHTTMIDSAATITEYIDGTDWRISANSNTTYSNAGLINNTAGKVIANYWLDQVYSREEGRSHRCGDYHIHDLDHLTGYCAGWSLRALLNEGFNGVRGRSASRPPSHFREALGQMTNFLGILQGEWAGAQAFSSFDTYLAPYVFRDQLSLYDIKKAILGFVYNLNVPARWGQSPFTNITIDWVVPKDLRDQIPTKSDKHIFAGITDEAFLASVAQRGVSSPEEMTYKDFTPEMELINRAYFEVMTEGDSTGQPFTFPIPTVNITEDFDWNGPNTDILFENTAKVGSAYFQNFIGSQYMRDDEGKLVPNPEAYKPDAVRSMCCRLQLDLRELLKRGGGLFGSAEMTGSIGVVTINMARLGYRFKGDKEGLFNELDVLMDRAKSTLEKKRVFIQDMYERGLFPYTARYLPGFNNHFSTIGVNGINEMIRNFSDDEFNISEEVGAEFAIGILDHMRDKMKEFQEATGNLYNLEATPAEGTTYRFAREDARRFGDIIQAGSGDDIYYTNSSQLPSGFTADPFTALDLQDRIQCKYTGGTVLHLYMSERVSDADACRRLVKKVMSNYALPYITITPLFSVCETHGYLNGAHEYCPKCDENIITSHRDNK